MKVKNKNSKFKRNRGKYHLYPALAEAIFEF